MLCMNCRSEISLLQEKIRHLELTLLKQQEDEQRKRTLFRGGSVPGFRDSGDSDSSNEHDGSGTHLQVPHKPQAQRPRSPLAAQHSLDSSSNGNVCQQQQQPHEHRHRPPRPAPLSLPLSNSQSTGSLHQNRPPRPPQPLQPPQPPISMKGKRLLRRGYTLGPTTQPPPHPMSPMATAAAAAKAGGSCGELRQAPPVYHPPVTPQISVSSSVGSSSELPTTPTVAGTTAAPSLRVDKVVDESGDASWPEGSPASSGTRSLWESPTLRKVIAPLKQSLSVSAEHLPRARSPLSKVPWAIRQANMAKCQSFD